MKPSKLDKLSDERHWIVRRVPASAPLPRVSDYLPAAILGASAAADLLTKTHIIADRQEPFSMTALLISLAASAAASAASLGLSLLLAPKPKPQDIGRANVKVVTAKYGTSIPRGYGIFACPAQVIWRDKIQEWVTTEQTGGKRRQPAINRYTYYVSFGVIGCQNQDNNQLLGLRRMWYDGVQVYPPGGGAAVPDGTNPPQLGYSGSPTTYVGGAQAFQILLGTQDTPWPSYESDVSTLGKTPAHRGFLTCWSWKMLLEPYYNRLPTSQLMEVDTRDKTAAAVCAREFRLAGLEDDEFDVSEIADLPIDGLVIGQQVAPRAVVERLGLFYHFAVVEWSGKLQAKRLPVRSRVFIPKVDLGAVVGGVEDDPQPVARWEIQAAGALELPRRAEVQYMDRDRIYESQTQGYGRQIFDQNGVISIDSTFITNPNEANRVAKVQVSRAWAEREQFNLKLPPSYVETAPGDVVEIDVGPMRYGLRVVRSNFAPDDVIELECVRQVDEAWEQTGIGSTGLFQRPEQGDTYVKTDPVPTSDVIMPTRLWLGVPGYFNDWDDNEDLIYFAGCMGTATLTEGQRPVWTGFQLFKNLAGKAGEGTEPGDDKYVAVGQSNKAAVLGWATTVLAPWTGVREGVDTVNKVRVKCYAGGVPPAVKPEVFDSVRTEGLILLGREMLQYRDVQPVGPDEYELGHLRRGLRDTHFLTGGHLGHATDATLADVFLVWDFQAVQHVLINQDEYGLERTFKAVTLNGNFESAAPVYFTPAHWRARD